MFKEARNFDAAERHYRGAQQLSPQDADLALQLGHFYKTVDRLEIAAAEYRRAAALAPDWAEPARELAELARRAAADTIAAPDPDDAVPAWELVPGPCSPRPSSPLDQIVFRRLGGRREIRPDGAFAFLSGVEALRGICLSDRPLVEASLMIDGKLIHREVITSQATGDADLLKAVFNLWVDLSAIPPGLHRLDLVLADASGWTRRHVERVVIGPPAPDRDELIDSDGVLVLAHGDSRGVEAQVRARASMIRPVDRLRPPPPERILVLRIDQLGDMVVSIPALRRLRALFPAARIVGLVSPVNADLARNIDLFDEVLVADVPDDPVRRRRTMTPAAQRELAALLAGHCFDVAIDLATSDVSRPLLKLAGARFTFGFDDGASPWLDGGISGRVRDRHNGGEASPQSSRITALVERLGTVFAAPAPLVRRPDLDPIALAPLGIKAGERFVILHAGGRIAFSRWAGFTELARALLDRHRLRVVLLTEGTALAESLPADLRAADRLTVLDQRLAFDELDALLSFAVAFVGNDSGPKHLAALRGTPVVSIHCARINWPEWGQEQTGVVISRRVPCAGCAIFYDDDECGKDVACMSDIGVAEVLAALEALLPAEA